ncbi:MAG TPA: hypothetical protein VFI46_14640 [Jiangellaceae bacterium]|nr:hypothetical protein [Jiangellaceae bacterium]
MNRIKHIAATAAVGTAVLVPATAAVAFAEPYPWHGPSEGASQPLQKTKAQIEYEERLQLGPLPGTGNEEPPSQPTADATGIPWETVGLAALGAGVLAAGGIVVARRSHRQPRPA